MPSRGDVGPGAQGATILALNGGSSSLKFALFGSTVGPERILSGKIERIGLPDATFSAKIHTTGISETQPLQAPDHAACVEFFFEWLSRKTRVEDLAAIGHRIVHGGPRFTSPHEVTAEVLDELKRLSPYDPEHLPAEIGWIEAFTARFPGLPQFACFDTSFHRDMPRVARLLPIPRRYADAGVVRYGFHGLSYEFCLAELGRVAGEEASRGRIILAHLGNGASMAAVRAGKSLDTTMGFTPAAGLPMSTRSGDLDPGLVAYFARTEGMTPDQFQEMVNRRSGLLALSETSPDMRDLLTSESRDVRAAEAVALFCYEAKKRVGAYTAALGGLDTLVFTGGIGENSPEIRARICAGLEWFGIEIDAGRNTQGADIVSASTSRVVVRVIHTDEELQIARTVQNLLSAPRNAG